ncbi:hypothetical protein GCM10020295_31610 [Streptomyces cinereospinus]
MPPTAGRHDVLLCRLRESGELHRDGVLTDDEFARTTAAVLRASAPRACRSDHGGGAGLGPAETRGLRRRPDPNDRLQVSSSGSRRVMSCHSGW